VIDTTTLAEITGLVRVSAGGNVVVSANDDSTTYAIGGAVGVGIGGGGGAGAVNVTSITKTTLANIGDAAIVDALANEGDIAGVPDGTLSGNSFGSQNMRGVAVLAGSSEDVTSVAGSAGGGAYVGIAGAVSVELITSTTNASIDGNAQINQNNAALASSLQSVEVAATNAVNVLGVAGSLGIGSAGIGASFDIGIIRNNTSALIGASSVRAKDETDVFALTNWSVNSNAIAVGAGLGGLGGGFNHQSRRGSRLQDRRRRGVFGRQRR
jgi:hypothetical protein